MTATLDVTAARAAVEERQAALDAQDELLAGLRREQTSLQSATGREAHRRSIELGQEIEIELKVRDELAAEITVGKIDLAEATAHRDFDAYDAGEVMRAQNVEQLREGVRLAIEAAEAIEADAKVQAKLNARATTLSGADGPLSGRRLPRRPHPAKKLGLTEFLFPAFVARLRALAKEIQ
jgi:multidrug resistance efflux pump